MPRAKSRRSHRTRCDRTVLVLSCFASASHVGCGRVTLPGDQPAKQQPSPQPAVQTTLLMTQRLAGFQNSWPRGSSRHIIVASSLPAHRRAETPCIRSPPFPTVCRSPDRRRAKEDPGPGRVQQDAFVCDDRSPELCSAAQQPRGYAIVLPCASWQMSPNEPK